MASPEENPVRFSPFSQRTPSEMSIVSIDHNYAKPWSTHPDASNAQPLRMLFMERFPRPETQDKDSSPEIVDIEGDDSLSKPMYDVSRARALMSECEKHAVLLRPDKPDSADDWEEHIASVRNSWSVLQNRIFAKVMRVLQADRLARLSIQETSNEPIQRRLQIDKAAKRVRLAFANVGWDMNLIMWLHNLFLENLRGHLFTSYLEVLQTLKAKNPLLTDRLMLGNPTKQDNVALDSLSGLLKRNWDPVLSSINQQKLKKLPENPLLLIIPSAPSSVSNPLGSKRHKFWHNQMASMGKIINVIPINNSTNITIANCVENMIATVRSKILEVKGHFPGRPIVLIGWQVGAIVACHVALMEIVQAVVCLGFPTTGVYGNRWDMEDQVYSCRTRTLFVVGQHASSSSLDMLEEIREKLRVETGLVVVGGADDQLRMCRSKKRRCGVTQCLVDRCIMDEVFDFLGNILSQVNIHPEPFEENELLKKPRKRKQKDLATTVSSQTTGSGEKSQSIKAAKMLPLSGSAATLLTGQMAISGNLKLGKKSSPKKRASKAGDTSGFCKNPMSQLGCPAPSSTSDQSKSSTSASEAAAIASAPELSNLLQSIKTTQSQKLAVGVSNVSASKSSATPPVLITPVSLSSTPSSVTTTTALTLSRFLATSGLLKSSSIMKPAELSSQNDETAVTQSSSVADTIASVKENPKQQPQILIRAGNTSEPFSFPLTFSVANKVLKSSPVMRIGNTIPSSQIQQLLTSVAPAITTAAISQGTSSSEVPTLLVTSSLSGSSIISAASSSFSFLSSTTTGRSSTSAVTGTQGTAISSTITSPGASIINIDSDSVFMKEKPLSAASTPATVSIDLGQIVSSNSNNILKFTSAPKVSLIPLTKQQVTHSGTSTDRILFSAPVQNSGASGVAQTVQSQQVHISKTTSQFSTYVTKSLQIISSEPSKNLSNLTATISSQRSLGLTPTSQFLSTLSSSSRLLTLQLAPVTKDSSATVVAMAKDEAERHRVSSIKSKEFKGHLKNIQLQDITLVPGGKAATSGANLSVFSHPGQDERSASTIDCLAKVSSSNTNSLLVTPSNRTGPLSTQVILQCRNTPGTATLVSSNSVSSPKMVMVTTTETLGQVSSLLESSPITLGDLPSKAVVSGQVTSILHSEYKQSGKAVLTPSLSTPSTTPTTTTITSPSQNPVGSSRASKSTVSSYTATSKAVLPTIASTRTRRIKTPKQYDL